MLTFIRDADELEWYVPAAILPSDLQISLNLINQFLEKPLDLEGKKAAQLLGKKARRRARRRAPSSGPESEADDEDLPKRKARKKKEEVHYKSAQFIEDSDAELGDDEEFYKKEAALRARTAIAAADGGNTNMKKAGTKKRKKRREAEGREKKKWRGGVPSTVTPSGDAMQEIVDSSTSDADDHANDFSRSEQMSSTPATTPPEDSAQTRLPRPRPQPNFERLHSPEVQAPRNDDEPLFVKETEATAAHLRSNPIFRGSSPVERPDEDQSDEEIGGRWGRRKTTKIVILSDREDE
jgi:replication fork protection complex subunit TIMELESS/Tof1/Swi1